MKKTILATLVFLALIAGTAQAAAPEKRIGIAAVVNTDIVTLSDISDRVQLYLLGAPGKPPADIRKQMETNILEKLIDEKLQLQEAKSLGISVTDAQVQEALSSIAAQNKSTPEDFKKRLAASGVKPETLYDQIRAELAWGQVARRKLRPQINVSESEIDTEIAQKGLPAAAPPQKGTMVHIKQIAIPLKPKDPENIVKAKMTRAAALKGEISSCTAMDEKMKDFPSPATRDMGTGLLEALPPPIRKEIDGLAIGELSQPLRAQDAVIVVMVCEKKEAGADPAPAVQSEAAREQVANKIGLRRMQQMQERYLRDLRATAFIDKRI